MTSNHPCCYVSNRRQQLVLLRCIGPEQFFHEKVLFPFEEWVFACPSGSDVEIWSHGPQGIELLDSFPAQEHQIREDSGAEADSQAEAPEARVRQLA